MQNLHKDKKRWLPQVPTTEIKNREEILETWSKNLYHFQIQALPLAVQKTPNPLQEVASRK